MMTHHSPTTNEAGPTPVELTPRRRALMGDFDKPDTAFSGGNYPPIPFDD